MRTRLFALVVIGALAIGCTPTDEGASPDLSSPSLESPSVQGPAASPSVEGSPSMESPSGLESPSPSAS